MGARSRSRPISRARPTRGAGRPRAVEALGPLTCLVNNASLFEMDKIETATRASWDAHIETNLRAPLVLSQGFAGQLPAGAHGNIVNMLDQRVWNLTPYFLSYTVAKMGLWTLTRTLALALAPQIRVNGIGPGPTLPSPRQSAAQFAKMPRHAARARHNGGDLAALQFISARRP